MEQELRTLSKMQSREAAKIQKVNQEASKVVGRGILVA
jgi:hypothetical protein